MCFCFATVEVPPPPPHPPQPQMYPQMVRRSADAVIAAQWNGAPPGPLGSAWSVSNAMWLPRMRSRQRAKMALRDARWAAKFPGRRRPTVILRLLRVGRDQDRGRWVRRVL
jgi:predicted outer membrane lipoprotein